MRPAAGTHGESFRIHTVRVLSKKCLYAVSQCEQIFVKRPDCLTPKSPTAALEISWTYGPARGWGYRCFLALVLGERKKGGRKREREEEWVGEVGGIKKKLASPFLSDSYFPVRPSKGGWLQPPRTSPTGAHGPLF